METFCRLENVVRRINDGERDNDESFGVGISLRSKYEILLFRELLFYRFTNLHREVDIDLNSFDDKMNYHFRVWNSSKQNLIKYAIEF